jgi:membrane carboxypeptidase/penicillin-binding protein PbpC
VEAWPPDIARYLKAFGARTLPYPPAAPDCPGAGSLEGPRLQSPLPGARFELRPELPWDQQQLSLRAQASPDAERLYWFVDQALVAECGPAETAHWPARAGRHQVSVVDSEGRGAQAEILVRAPQARSTWKAPENEGPESLPQD